MYKMQPQDTFYLFETHVPFIFKYGYTSRNINARLSDYIGVAKPKRLIGHFTIASGDGKKTEQMFDDFIKNKNVQSISKFGNEYFAYYDNVNDLYNEFYDMKKDVNMSITKDANVTNKDVCQDIINMPNPQEVDDIKKYLDKLNVALT